MRVPAGRPKSFIYPRRV